jgi:hypothetical protein
MRRWLPHDPGRSCLFHTITHYVTNQTNSQNAGALPQGVRRLPIERYWELRTEIEREQETLQRRRFVNRDAQPLKEALHQEWTVQEWGSRPLEWRRAVLRLAVERIEVTPVPQSGAAKGHVGAAHNPDRVKIKMAG